MGVDGCKGGWVSAALAVRDDGTLDLADLEVVERFAEVVAAHPEAVVIGVDIPMGGLDGGDRLADKAARSLLPRKRKPTVFAPPPTAALAERDFAKACAIAEKVTGKRISRQAHAIAPKILEVGTWWEGNPDRFFEVHPELAFQIMAKRQSADTIVVHKKSTGEGARERTELLASVGVDIPVSLTRRGAALDDVLDAVAVAWSASRIANGTAGSAPHPPDVDDAGREIAIWF